MAPAPAPWVTAMPCAPYWLMPTPWPNPPPSNTKSGAPACAVALDVCIAPARGVALAAAMEHTLTTRTIVAAMLVRRATRLLWTDFDTDHLVCVRPRPHE